MMAAAEFLSVPTGVGNRTGPVLSSVSKLDPSAQRVQCATSRGLYNSRRCSPVLVPRCRQLTRALPRLSPRGHHFPPCGEIIRDQAPATESRALEISPRIWSTSTSQWIPPEVAFSRFAWSLSYTVAQRIGKLHSLRRHLPLSLQPFFKTFLCVLFSYS